MPLAANRKRYIQKWNKRIIRNMNVAAGAVIYEGACCALDAAGLVVPAPAAQTLDFIGYARLGFDNTGGAATTNTPVVLEIGQVERVTFAVAPALTDIGEPIFYVNDDTVTVTDPATIPEARVGVLVRIEAGAIGWIDTDKSLT